MKINKILCYFLLTFFLLTVNLNDVELGPVRPPLAHLHAPPLKISNLDFKSINCYM